MQGYANGSHAIGPSGKTSRDTHWHHERGSVTTQELVQGGGPQGNASATMFITFTRERKGLGPVCSLRTNGKRVAVFSSAKYLGETLDVKLT